MSGCPSAIVWSGCETCSAILEAEAQEQLPSMLKPAHFLHTLADFWASALTFLLAQVYWNMSSSNML